MIYLSYRLMVVIAQFFLWFVKLILAMMVLIGIVFAWIFWLSIHGSIRAYDWIRSRRQVPAS